MTYPRPAPAVTVAYLRYHWGDVYAFTSRTGTVTATPGAPGIRSPPPPPGSYSH